MGFLNNIVDTVTGRKKQEQEADLYRRFVDKIHQALSVDLSPDTIPVNPTEEQAYNFLGESSPKQGLGSILGNIKNSIGGMFDNKFRSPIPTEDSSPVKLSSIQKEVKSPIPLATATPIPMPTGKPMVSKINLPTPPPDVSGMIDQVFGEQANNAKQVAASENGTFQPDRDSPANTDGSVDRGIFQINSNTFNGLMKRRPDLMEAIGVNNFDQMKDPILNIKVAKIIYDEGGWGRWFGPSRVGLKLE